MHRGHLNGFVPRRRTGRFWCRRCVRGSERVTCWFSCVQPGGLLPVGARNGEQAPRLHDEDSEPPSFGSTKAARASHTAQGDDWLCSAGSWIRAGCDARSDVGSGCSRRTSATPQTALSRRCTGAIAVRASPNCKCIERSPFPPPFPQLRSRAHHQRRSASRGGHYTMRCNRHEKLFMHPDE
jgi:hypothetical protein